MINKIGIVTVTYNSEDVLEDFYSSIHLQNHKNFILYVIDNNSSDSTADKVKALADERTVYIQNSQNVGVAEGNNQGIVRAIEDKCDYVLLLNNDTIFESDTLTKLLEGLVENNSDISVPKIYYADKKEYLWYAGGNFDSIGCRVNHLGYQQRDIGLYNTVEQITYAPTCCMLIKSDVFEDVGLMDEKYFVYEDDVDFCFRAMMKKKKMVYLPNFTFYHKVGGLTNKDRSFYASDFEIKFITRNHIYRCKKFFTPIKGVYIVWYLLRENIKIILQRQYKRSMHSFLLFNKAFFSGLMYK